MTRKNEQVAHRKPCTLQPRVSWTLSKYIFTWPKCRTLSVWKLGSKRIALLVKASLGNNAS